MLLIAYAFVGVGCQTPSTAADNPFEIDAREYDRIYEAAQLALADAGFRLDQRDYRFGRVTTMPLGSPTVFEPWHRSVTTGKQRLNATFSDERRTASVLLQPLYGESENQDIDLADASAPAAYNLYVEVLVERKQVPVHHLTGSTQGDHILVPLDESPRDYTRREIDSEYWLAVGRDPYLEQRLLADIVRRSVYIPE